MKRRKMKTLKRDIIESLLIMAAFLALVAYSDTLKVDLVTSRGPLTNQVAVASQSLLTIEDSEFYQTDITVTEFDMLAAVRDGTNHYQKIDYSFTTTEGKRATLVAPNIAVGCRHLHHGVGEVMIFGSHTAKVIRVELDPIEGFDAYYDYCFMKLDRDLPIKPCAIAPINFQSYFDLGGWSWFSSKIPLCFLNQQGIPSVGYIHVMTNAEGSFVQGIGAVVGDSGSPVFMVLKGNPVLVGVMTSVKNFNLIQKDLMPVTRGWGL